MTLEEIEDLLREKKSPPGNMSAPDRMLYTELGRIAQLFRAEIISLDDADTARRQAVEWWEIWNTDKARYAAQIRQYTAFSRLAAEANKSGCEICRKIAKFYDGRKENGR